jgi:ATPase family associated with various cellular activities (AAA)
VKKTKKIKSPLAMEALRKHFGKLRLTDLVSSNRVFPMTSRPDLQIAVERMFSSTYRATLIGVHRHFSHEPLNTAELVTEGHYPPVIGPLQHDEVDVGSDQPVRCLQNGVWLGMEKKLPFSVLLTSANRFGQELGVKVEMAVPPGNPGAALSRSFFTQLENLVNAAGSYKGKVVSLEASDNYSGYTGKIRVHKLHSVRREEVILPHKTLELLDRNVNDFINQREKLNELGMPVKKGLLLYGPPGTGKTHTIHYLASQLKDHTTLLITSEQVGLLGMYMQLARFLQPAMVVIEDVDLIARDRNQMHGPCEESLLNKLLNEMDGLREDAAILFVLTTNRPEQLEAALASRPGRIDQAIEFPLPDEIGREKLIRLYARNAPLAEEVVPRTVRKTRQASAAFIKELLRRAAQYYISEHQQGELQQKHVDAALEEMLFSGGALNLKLLGADASIAEPDMESDQVTTKFRN